MPSPRRALPAAVLFLVTAWSGAALADVPPPNGCAGPVGAACATAGPTHDQAGVCTTSVCTHAGPGADGKIVTTEHACLLCELATAAPAPPQGSAASPGAAPSNGTPSTGTPGNGTPSNATPSGGAKSRCSVSSVGLEGRITGVMALVGLGAILVDRRRRRG